TTRNRREPGSCERDRPSVPSPVTTEQVRCLFFHLPWALEGTDLSTGVCHHVNVRGESCYSGCHHAVAEVVNAPHNDGFQPRILRGSEGVFIGTGLAHLVAQGG